MNVTMNGAGILNDGVPDKGELADGEALGRIHPPFTHQYSPIFYPTTVKIDLCHGLPGPDIRLIGLFYLPKIALPGSPIKSNFFKHF
jgi:hypothetical protein